MKNNSCFFNTKFSIKSFFFKHIDIKIFLLKTKKNSNPQYKKVIWFSCSRKKSMPQIDKVTFLTTVYWVFVFYFFLYLDLSVTYLYKFLTVLKLRHKRACWVYRNVQIYGWQTRILAARVLF